MNLSRCAVLVIALLAPLAAFAQDALGLASKVEATRYNPLARQARIQGDVRLRSGPDGITTISGHPLLVQEAVNSLRGLGKLSDVEIEATYHFVLVDGTEIRTTTRVEKKGNRFERLILHTLMMKTDRVVQDTECIERPILKKNRIEVTGNRIEVWVYGPVNSCLQPSTSQIALH
jgi:hypothetical protein